MNFFSLKDFNEVSTRFLAGIGLHSYACMGSESSSTYGCN